MAEIAWKYEQQMLINGWNQAKWAKHYSSDDQILLVGEGDFSFSASLARVFGSADNIVATSLDSYDLVIKKYKMAQANLQILYNYGAQLLHEVDATRMKLHTDLHLRKFDRIIYNFPHAGFLGDENDQRVINKHRNLVRGFFENASCMLRPGGEVHVTHKTTGPFITWNIEDLASKSSLALLGCVEFNITDYPGYNNKRGDGSRSDHPFPLGKCSTYKFISSKKSNNPHCNYQQSPRILSNSGNRVMNLSSGDCFTIFKEYFDEAVSMFGETDDHLSYSVRSMLGMGFERVKMVNHVNPLNDYVNLLKELRYMSKRRTAYLQNHLLELDHHRYGL
ncbi:hypothetical protein SSX86_031978 [Deinandra increscens subsp. villosa]|uniref:25S rRNA (uridine-N(3))-methyltransferase BMT5-like domain-containing protein n=1 Tax=Deinandra increscens subsp. villosa TaxID=3103831 RepID=A0AAP0C844_9ASTR